MNLICLQIVAAIWSFRDLVHILNDHCASVLEFYELKTQFSKGEREIIKELHKCHLTKLNMTTLFHPVQFNG